MSHRIFRIYSSIVHTYTEKVFTISEIQILSSNPISVLLVIIQLYIDTYMDGWVDTDRAISM